MRIHTRHFGADALLIGVDSLTDAEALYGEVLRRVASGEIQATDVVPAARTVLLDGVSARDTLALEIPQWAVPPVKSSDGEVVEVPVRYDGPDLVDVAALWGVEPSGVAAMHQATTYRVAFGGFAPGFGYLTGLPPERFVPRRDSPRTQVPAGAVALAGEFTGIYPRESPGGWQLIGTAVDVVLWDEERDPPALLVPGTRVRFREVA